MGIHINLKFQAKSLHSQEIRKDGRWEMRFFQRSALTLSGAAAANCCAAQPAMGNWDHQDCSKWGTLNDESEILALAELVLHVDKPSSQVGSSRPISQPRHSNIVYWWSCQTFLSLISQSGQASPRYLTRQSKNMLFKCVPKLLVIRNDL